MQGASDPTLRNQQVMQMMMLQQRQQAAQQHFLLQQQRQQQVAVAAVATAEPPSVATAVTPNNAIMQQLYQQQQLQMQQQQQHQLQRARGGLPAQQQYQADQLLLQQQHLLLMQQRMQFMQQQQQQQQQHHQQQQQHHPPSVASVVPVAAGPGVPSGPASPLRKSKGRASDGGESGMAKKPKISEAVDTNVYNVAAASEVPSAAPAQAAIAVVGYSGQPTPQQMQAYHSQQAQQAHMAYLQQISMSHPSLSKKGKATKPTAAAPHTHATESTSEPVQTATPSEPTPIASAPIPTAPQVPSSAVQPSDTSARVPPKKKKKAPASGTAVPSSSTGAAATTESDDDLLPRQLFARIVKRALPVGFPIERSATRSLMLSSVEFMNLVTSEANHLRQEEARLKSQLSIRATVTRMETPQIHDKANLTEPRDMIVPLSLVDQSLKDHLLPMSPDELTPGQNLGDGIADGTVLTGRHIMAALTNLGFHEYASLLGAQWEAIQLTGVATTELIDMAASQQITDIRRQRALPTQADAIPIPHAIEEGFVGVVKDTTDTYANVLQTDASRAHTEHVAEMRASRDKWLRLMSNPLYPRHSITRPNYVPRPCVLGTSCIETICARPAHRPSTHRASESTTAAAPAPAPASAPGAAVAPSSPHKSSSSKSVAPVPKKRRPDAEPKKKPPAAPLDPATEAKRAEKNKARREAYALARAGGGAAAAAAAAANHANNTDAAAGVPIAPVTEAATDADAVIVAPHDEPTVAAAPITQVFEEETTGILEESEDTEPPDEMTLAAE